MSSAPHPLQNNGNVSMCRAINICNREMAVRVVISRKVFFGFSSNRLIPWNSASWRLVSRIATQEFSAIRGALPRWLSQRVCWGFRSSGLWRRDDTVVVVPVLCTTVAFGWRDWAKQLRPRATSSIPAVEYKSEVTEPSCVVSVRWNVEGKESSGTLSCIVLVSAYGERWNTFFF